MSVSAVKSEVRNLGWHLRIIGGKKINKKGLGPLIVSHSETVNQIQHNLLQAMQ